MKTKPLTGEERLHIEKVLKSCRTHYHRIAFHMWLSNLVINKKLKNFQLMYYMGRLAFRTIDFTSENEL